MQVYLKEEQGQSLFLTPFPFEKSAVALGGFDAMHIGHQAIIQKMVDDAKSLHLTSVVYLFRNQPRTVVTGEACPSVCSLSKRLALLEEWGVDVVIAEWFTPEYQAVSPETFVKEYLKNWLKASYVAAGFDYRFGEKGSGDMKLLQQLCRHEEIQVYEQAPVMIDGSVVSSTRIRKLLSQGAVAEAERCLGRPFSVCGQVTEGNRIGRTMGFPTANIDYPEDMVLPGQGVYQTCTRAGGAWYSSITHLGSRPTVTDSNLRLETHLLGFQGDLYGTEIEVAFCKYLREIKKFSNLEELKEQLKKDKKNAEM